MAGNIPYNITSPLLAKALTAPLPSSITFLVQREVADRVVAVPGGKAYGALTIGVQTVASPTRLFSVGRSAFKPAPQVDSAVLRLVPHAEPLLDPAALADFRRLVTSLFSYRRKRMLKAVREALTMSAEDARAVLDRAGIDADMRPEQIDVDGFVRLFAARDEGATSLDRSGALGD